jgi:hypothetical protein
MPIGASAGTLDIENATLRSNAIAVLTNLVAGNDQVRQSGPPALEVYGDPSHGGNEPRLELVSNIADTVSNSFTRLTSNAGVFSIETGTSGTSDNGTITFGGFQNERLRITSDGNVGVGTDNPDKKLHVYTTASESNSQLFLQSANRYATMQMSDDSGGVMVQNDQGDLRLLTGFDASMGNGSETMRIKDNGNVGIGTTDPVSDLHVTSGTNDGTTLINLVVNQSSDATVYYRKIAYVSNNSGHVLIKGILGGHTQSQGNATVDVKFSMRDGFTALGTCMGTLGNSNILVKDNTSDNRQDIYLVTGLYSYVNLQVYTIGGEVFGTNENGRTTTAPSGTTTHDLKLNFTTFRVDDDGNVGIGTTSPSSVFNTYGGSLWDGSSMASKVCATLEVGRGSGSGASAEDAGTGAILEFRHHSDYRSVTVESVSEGNYSSQMGLRFKTMTDTNGPQERMRIDGDGNVGIGTANPSYALSFFRAGMDVKTSIVNPMSTTGAGAFNFGVLYVGDNVVSECICIYNPTVENSYLYKCGYVQWIQMKVRGEGIQNTIQIIKSFSSDSSTVTITANGTGSGSGQTILTVSSGTANISYTARVFYRALDTP